MEKEEGYMFLEGYIPTAGSGVTIATGYDLGHGPNIFCCLNDTALKTKLTPFRGLKTRAAVKNANLNAKDLRISLDEAKMIDQCMLDYNKRYTICKTSILIPIKNYVLSENNFDNQSLI